MTQPEARKMGLKCKRCSTVPGPSACSPAVRPRPEAWAWRALAVHRLSEVGRSRVALDTADNLARSEQPMDRTWRELDDIILAAALAGDWRRAFAAAEAPGDERARTLARACAVELYEELRERDAR